MSTMTMRSHSRLRWTKRTETLIPLCFLYCSLNHRKDPQRSVMAANLRRQSGTCWRLRGSVLELRTLTTHRTEQGACGKGGGGQGAGGMRLRRRYEAARRIGAARSFVEF